MESGYQVIARRWRPRQFSELVGQDHIVRTLGNAIRTGRIAHAYLFVGPRGTGKTTTARLFAKALNADGGPNIEPDNESEISREIMTGTCLDVIEIDGASNNSVEQVRSLREECQYAPARCTYKIYIIDEVHMLSTAAFNALLKTLEEPPPHVKFFFATTEANKVLDTIVSRCQRFEFRPIEEDVIAEKLRVISEAEGITVEADALRSIARLANGGMRDAQSILDQMISFCGESVSAADVLDVYGLASRKTIDDLAAAIAGLSYPRILEAVELFNREGRDLFRVIADLEVRFREALVDAISHSNETSLFGHPLSTEQIMRVLDTLRSGMPAVQRGLSERANFEVVLLKAAEASRSRALDSLVAELQKFDPEKKKPEDLKLGAAPHGRANNSHADTQGSDPTSKPETVAASKPEEAPQSFAGNAIASSAGASLGEAHEDVSGSPGNSVATTTRPSEGADSENISSAQDLIERIPSSVREALDRTLRADFAQVRRIDCKDRLE